MAGAPRHVSVDLLAEKSSAVPGTTLTVAVRERIAPGWHTYWTNPGDAGEPTSIEWSLPQGVSAGPILWPLPHTIPVGGLTEYGYSDEILLLTAIQVPEGLSSQSLTLSAKVSYLVCQDICVPETANVTLTLPVASVSGPTDFTDRIAAARKALPAPWPGTATYAADKAHGTLRLTASTSEPVLEDVTSVRFFPLTWGPVSNSAAQQAAIEGSRVALDLAQGDTKETPDQLDGLLVLTKADAAATRVGYLISAKRGPDFVSSGGFPDQRLPPAGKAATPSGVSGSTAMGTGFAILFAFLGGVILNLMPCVFPVLALKALGFADRAGRNHRREGLFYLGGVLASFAVLAVVIAALRAGSAALGWGFQFQSPAFVLALALLFFVMGLSLSGSLSLGNGVTSLGGALTVKSGDTGFFFTGALAAIAATPCTAPFMGAAIGFAVTEPIFVLAAVMLGLGLGFAAPVVVLSFLPAFQRILPRPGPWMDTLKQVLAFPLYATAAWLVWVLSIQSGSDGVMAAALAFVGIGFAAWLSGKTALSPLPLKLIAPALGVLAFAAGLSLATTGQTGDSAPAALAEGLIEEPFSLSRLDALTAEGKPVFVNLTAAWCITCKVNERVALKSGAVAKAFRSEGIVYLKGDWTRPNAEISDLLHRFGRAGVPLYLFYPGKGAEPRVLPQLLTAGLVLDEIKRAMEITTPSPAKGA